MEVIMKQYDELIEQNNSMKKKFEIKVIGQENKILKLEE
jgi:hypothetical protein